MGEKSEALKKPEKHQFLFRGQCVECDSLMVVKEVVPVCMPPSPTRDKHIEAFRRGTARFMFGDEPVCEECQTDMQKEFVAQILNAIDEM